MKAKEIIKKIEEKFPVSNAEDWDNVGLLIGDFNKEIKKIQFSLDTTLGAIENAINNNVDMIITHHPTIFRSIKSITENEIIGKKIRKLIKNDINVYTLHTNLDSTLNGLNDYLLKKLGEKDFKILSLSEDKNCGIGRFYSLPKEVELVEYIQKIKDKLSINNLRVISKDIHTKIKKIAIINGSAMSYWREAKSKKVDLFITGDIGYHDALDALESGLNIIDFGHYESERFFYEILKEILEDNMETKKIETLVFNDGPIFKFF